MAFRIIQYTCASDADLKDYQQNFSEELQGSTPKKFMAKMHAFRTELEVIQDF